jgi:hypothetical protein
MIRRGLRDRMLNLPLNDARRLTRHLEDPLQKVLGNWCAKQAAAGKGPNR